MHDGAAREMGMPMLGTWLRTPELTHGCSPSRGMQKEPEKFQQQLPGPKAGENSPIVLLT